VPRLTADQWETVRAEREAGASFKELEAKHGISSVSIFKRSKKNGWGDGRDVAEAVRRKVNEKVNGVGNGVNPEKKAAAIDAAASETVELIKRHRDEWRQVAGLRQEALGKRKDDTTEAFNAAKLAKITAEMTAIQQAGERRAWGLDTATAAGSSPATIKWEGAE
jgi:hypothetical protein